MWRTRVPPPILPQQLGRRWRALLDMGPRPCFVRRPNLEKLWTTMFAHFGAVDGQSQLIDRNP